MYFYCRHNLGKLRREKACSDNLKHQFRLNGQLQVFASKGGHHSIQSSLKRIQRSKVPLDAQFNFPIIVVAIIQFVAQNGIVIVKPFIHRAKANA